MTSEPRAAASAPTTTTTSSPAQTERPTTTPAQAPAAAPATQSTTGSTRPAASAAAPESPEPASAPAAAPSGVVRRATADDAAEVAWLAALTFPLACPPEASRTEMATHIAQKLTPARFREWATSDRHALLVYEDDGALLGYALLVVGSPEGETEAATVRQASGREAPYVELSKIYVQPDVQGGGVAGELMRAAAATAAELGPGLPYWLGTNAQNQRAQAFYRKHGFEVVGRRTYVVGGLEHDDVVLLRTR